MKGNNVILKNKGLQEEKSEENTQQRRDGGATNAARGWPGAARAAARARDSPLGSERSLSDSMLPTTLIKEVGKENG
jgi:hypothetical protein